jgi:hypothetical protein
MNQKSNSKKKYVTPEVKEVWNEGLGVDKFFYII